MNSLVQLNDLVVQEEKTLSGYPAVLGSILWRRNVATEGTHAFGLTSVSMEFAELEQPLMVTVIRRRRPHPADHEELQGNYYWNITADGTGFQASVTLPHALENYQSAAIWRFDGANWSAARTATSATTVSLDGVTESSDWAVGLMPTTAMQMWLAY